MAWLHATPKPPPGSSRAKAEASADLPKVSRLDQFKNDGIDPPMPPNPLPHIIAQLIEIGLSESNGMSQTALSWREIDAWCVRASVDLPPWDAKIIRALSVAYVAESRRAESENSPAPWRAEVTQRERDLEASRLRAMFS